MRYKLLFGAFIFVTSLLASHLVSADSESERLSVDAGLQQQEENREAFHKTQSKIQEQRKVERDHLVLVAYVAAIEEAERQAEVARRAQEAHEAATRAAAAKKAAEPRTTAPSHVHTHTHTDNVWDALAQCESGGNWFINTGNGYYGGLQFSLASWESVGGTGYPHEHPAATQIEMGRRLQARQGWGAWPACSRKLGLR